MASLPVSPVRIRTTSSKGSTDTQAGSSASRTCSNAFSAGCRNSSLTAISSRRRRSSAPGGVAPETHQLHLTDRQSVDTGVSQRLGQLLERSSSDGSNDELQFWPFLLSTGDARVFSRNLPVTRIEVPSYSSFRDRLNSASTPSETERPRLRIECTSSAMGISTSSDSQSCTTALCRRDALYDLDHRCHCLFGRIPLPDPDTKSAVT